MPQTPVFDPQDSTSLCPCWEYCCLLLHCHIHTKHRAIRTFSWWKMYFIGTFALKYSLVSPPVACLQLALAATVDFLLYPGVYLPLACSYKRIHINKPGQPGPSFLFFSWTPLLYMKSRLSLGCFSCWKHEIVYPECFSIFHPDRTKKGIRNTPCFVSLGLQTVLIKSAGFNVDLSTSSFSTASDNLDCLPEFLMRDPLTGFRDLSRILRALHNVIVTRVWHSTKQSSPAVMTPTELSCHGSPLVLQEWLQKKQQAGTFVPTLIASFKTRKLISYSHVVLLFLMHMYKWCFLKPLWQLSKELHCNNSSKFQVKRHFWYKIFISFLAKKTVLQKYFWDSSNYRTSVESCCKSEEGEGFQKDFQKPWLFILSYFPFFFYYLML